MSQELVSKDTLAWRFQVWTSFIVAVTASVLGITYLPVESWVRAYVAMGFLFTIGATFTLAKTTRDNQEALRLINRIKGAKQERIIREYELSSDLETV